MAGMEFEYDEQGTTFYYFILAILVLILFPWTIILLRKKKPGKYSIFFYKTVLFS